MRRIWAALAAGGIAAACTTAAPEPRATVERGSADAQDRGPRVVVDPRAPVAVPEVEAPPASPSPSSLREAEAKPVSPSPSPSSPAEAEVPAAAIDAAAAELRALPPDPTPSHTTNDRHYLVSNERRLDLFRPELDDLGGVLLGVGSDQSYLMAAWSRAALLVIVDFDQQVIDVHAIHGALMTAAPTSEEFLRLWSEEGAAEARALVAAAHPARPELLALYDDARALVDRRLRRLARRYEELDVRSWIDTPAQYRHVADLHARGRVVALRGDFTRDGLLRRVAAVLQAHALPVKVLYLSNIEQYLTYRRPFRDNVLALPFDDDTVVLRTLPGRPAGFQYLLQRGDDFHAWMRTPKVWSVYRIRGLAKGEHLVAGERWVAGPPTG